MFKLQGNISYVCTCIMNSGNLFTSRHPDCIGKNVLSYETWYVPCDPSRRDGKALRVYKNVRGLQYSFLLRLIPTYKL